MVCVKGERGEGGRIELTPATAAYSRWWCKLVSPLIKRVLDTLTGI